MNPSDFDYLKKNLEKFPELLDAFKNPKIIGNEIIKINEPMALPILICENPDIELPKVPAQLNFIVPMELRKSKEIYVQNIKNDIIMYKKLYEKNSSLVNKIIDDTKESLKNLFIPIKKLHDNIKNYSYNFEGSIEQLTIPLKNGKKGLENINYQNYPKDKKNQFLKDKKEIIKEIDVFIKEANEFYIKYRELNNSTSEDIKNFLERFNKLAEPAKELTIFMRKLMKAFESSSEHFRDFKNKKKIDEAFQKIKEPINEFSTKIKNIENLLESIKSIKKERIDQLTSISNEIMGKKKNLEEISKKVSEKIRKIRIQYNEPEEPLTEVNMPAAIVVNSKDVSNEIENQGGRIGEKTDKSIKIIGGDIDKIINQTRLDLLFIMDITNSMEFYLDQVKTDILKMISNIKAECAGVDIFLGFIGYKDFNDLDLGEDYIDLEFTTDYESIQKNIEFVEPHGGGDIPEDLCGGLELAINKDWKGRTRFAILVTDSPCHGTKYHDLGKELDNYPEGDRDQKRKIEEQIETIAQKEISLFCLKINDSTDKMFKIFQEVYNKSKNKNSKNNFVIEKGEELIDIVTKNTISMFQHREKLEIN